MNITLKKKLLVAVLASLWLPMVASAADVDLMNRIDTLSRELEALKTQVKANELKAAQTAQEVKAVATKSDATALDDLRGQVKKLEDKSLGKWLTVGGDYRFRYDYLQGQSKTFTDVNATFANAQQRLQADFENYKKRVARTSEEVVTRAVADVVAKLLPVLDALDLAQAHFTNADTSELDSAEAKALIQARGLLLDTLKKEGLDRVDAAGVSFDPQIHDAVMHIEGDGSGEQIVDDILRAGYQWKGTVVRPAMVRVKG